MELSETWVETTHLHQSRPLLGKGWKSIPGKRGLGRAAPGRTARGDPLANTPCPPFSSAIPPAEAGFQLGGTWQGQSAP